MDVLKKYQIFFTLRDEYPEHKDLISELMSYLFKHNDTFSNMTYLNGSFDEKDIKFIFEKLNLVIVKRVIYSNLRSTKQTIVELDIKWHCNSDCQFWGNLTGCSGEKNTDSNSPVECPYYIPIIDFCGCEPEYL